MENEGEAFGVYFGKGESTDVYFPKPCPQALLGLIMFGNIRDLRLLVKKGKIIGIRFLNEQAMRLCSELNHFPPNIEKIALKEAKKQIE